MAGQGGTSAARAMNRRALAIFVALLLAASGIVGVSLVDSSTAQAVTSAASANRATAQRIAAKRLAAKRAAAKRAAARRAALARARLAAQAREAALRAPAPVRVVAPRVTSTYTDGDVFGDWRVVFAGYGSVGAYAADAKRLRLAPQAVTSPSATSAALAVSRQAFTATKLKVNATVTTTAQLRQNSAANAWEVAWLVWDYVDNEHFYYAVAKPNGWELGKRDPAYPGGQRFLATGNTPAVAVGAAAEVNVVRNVVGSASQITLTVNGSTVTTFIDSQRAYSQGSVGAYTEDAAVEFARVAVNGTALRTK